MSSSHPTTGSGRGPDRAPVLSYNDGVLTLTVTPEKSDFPEGSFPDFKVAIKNTGKAPVKFLRYMLRYRLMLAMTVKDDRGGEWGLYPFKKGVWEKYQSKDLVTISPGGVITESLKLSTIREEGWVFMPVSDQAPVLMSKHGLGGFPAGTYTFNTGLFPGAAIYVGQEGVHDNRLESRDLPEQLPGFTPAGAGDVNKEELRALTTVKFAKRA